MESVRSDENLLKIQSLISPHIVIDNFLSETELKSFFEFRDSLEKKTYSDHNKKRFDLSLANHEAVPQFFHKRLSVFVKNYYMRLSYFMDRESPFQLHCDSGNNPLEIPYKNIILSLDCEGPQGKLALFKQRGLKSLFFVDGENPSINYEDIKKAEHRPVFGKTSENFQYIKGLNFESKEQFDRNHFHHIKPEHLEGFEIESVVEHKFNRLLIFDACQFHCSIDSYPQSYGRSRRFTIFSNYKET